MHVIVGRASQRGQQLLDRADRSSSNRFSGAPEGAGLTAKARIERSSMLS
jgi:hypothetical protein